MNALNTKGLSALIAVSVAISGSIVLACAPYHPPAEPDLSDARIQQTFKTHQLNLNNNQINLIRSEVKQAVEMIQQFPQGNSKIKFNAVQIADELKLNPQIDSSALDRIMESLTTLANSEYRPPYPMPEPQPMPEPKLSWADYFNDTIGLNHKADFLELVNARHFSPVKISWEDIGRYENSAWGDRISDVGIWVRQDENDAASAQLALSVRRDNNFRDKVLMVPASKIKVHGKQAGQTIEWTLPERLRQLGLSSQTHDKNVIVSNQFAIVPVPAHTMRSNYMSARYATPPRAAFNFSIFPYGSTNMVITDVIEGSSNAIVGPGQHQLLYSNVNGQKAPFTASRAEDRQDLLKLEADLKAKGMDVDVQRYYLIQVPLKRNARIGLSNMGTPPGYRHYNTYIPETDGVYPAAPAMSTMGGAMYKSASPKNAAKVSAESSDMQDDKAQNEYRKKEEAGLTKVAIGHGETEGRYFEGSGYRNQRAEEPIRVTVIYFVTPVGQVTPKDMQTFANAFEQWDTQAIWGGSFVTANKG